MTGKAKPHWLTAAKHTWTPDVVVAFDTETTEVPENETLVHLLRCWDAVTLFRHGVRTDGADRSSAAGTEPAQLADHIEAHFNDANEIWTFAHNLNFDLAVTQLPNLFTSRGWHVDAYGLSKESNWWVLKRPPCKLVIADSWSWVPTSLETMGHDIGRRKLPLPGTDEGLKQWHARCRRDAEILADCLAVLMDWWDQWKLGRWSITGAGCGWSAFRTMTGDRRIVVGPDPPRTDFERLAIHGGRKEVFQVGEFSGEWIADYDFQAAYPSIAAHFPLPYVPADPFVVTPDASEPQSGANTGILAACTVETDIPCVPARIDGEVWWPTGTFRTVLATPELEYAREVGASVEVHAGYTYKLDKRLMPWATWVLALGEASRDAVPALVRRMAKGWSRSVIGKFAGHRSTITNRSPATGPNWRIEVGHNLDTGRPLEVLTMGGFDLTTEHEFDGSEIFPAVLAFVESHCRVALARMIGTRRPARILQVNTDGWWERRVVRAAAYEVPEVPFPHTVVRKACVNEVVILGPDHLESPTDRRLAGVPHLADRASPQEFTWHDWPGLRWQLEHAAQGEYHRPRRNLELKASYARRWVLESGETVAVTCRVDDDGHNVILPFFETQGRRNGDRLAAHQDERLAALPLDANPPPVLFDRSGPRLWGRVE